MAKTYALYMAKYGKWFKNINPVFLELNMTAFLDSNEKIHCLGKNRAQLTAIQLWINEQER